MRSSSSSSNENVRWIEANMNEALEKRRTVRTIRRLQTAPTNTTDAIDFSSNDYLGLAQSATQAALVNSRYDHTSILGATGSRLLSGDSAQFQEMEANLCAWHDGAAALLCNSGYDANLSVVSSLPCNCIVYDEYAHNSIHMGMRLWKNNDINKRLVAFQHNDCADLQRQLQAHKLSSNVVIIESVYSMDGDVAPVKRMLDLCQIYNAQLVVDEAHGLGIYGLGVIARDGLTHHPNLHCSIYTFGKAAGCHGAAVICTSKTLKEYLVNYAYPFIYSTALPPHSLTTIQCSYETMTGPVGDSLRRRVFDMVELFRTGLRDHCVDSGNTLNKSVYLLPSSTPIQALMISGNKQCTTFCQKILYKSNQKILLYPIKTPTVPAGLERVRIILHSHNSDDQVHELISLIKIVLHEMGLADTTGRARL
jgi:8-amino-7-oxononanoate synthase